MRVHFLDFPVDCLSIDDVINFLIKRIDKKARTRIVTLNPETVMIAKQSPILKKAIVGADLVVPDGIGIVISIRSRGYRIERIAGIDLAHLLMAYLARREGKVFLVGGAPGVASIAAKRLERELSGLRIVGAVDGYLSAGEEDLVIDRIIAAQPDLLIVGMGMPQQELWMDKYWKKLNVPVGIGVGGSIDVWAGKIRRAPLMIRRMGLEWLYRVGIQPWRWCRVLRLLGFVIIAVSDLRKKGVIADEECVHED